MAGCLFCAIVAGETSAAVIRQDDATLGFLDHRPAARGHTLVVPRHHVEHLWDASGEDAAAVGRAVHAVAAILRERLQPDGLTVRQNTGAASGQVVGHLHVHLVPRWHGDGNVGWPWPPPDPTVAAEVHGLLTR